MEADLKKLISWLVWFAIGGLSMFVFYPLINQCSDSLVVFFVIGEVIILAIWLFDHHFISNKKGES
jgi:hypothetical protein